MTKSAESEQIDRLLDKAHADILAGDTGMAIAELQRIFGIDKGNLRARSLFGLCAVMEGDLSTAEQNLKFVLDRDPQDPIALEGMRGLEQRRAALAAQQARAATAEPPPPGAPPPAPPLRPGLGRRILTGLRHMATYAVAAFFGAVFAPLAAMVAWNLTADLHGAREIRAERYLFEHPLYFLAAAAGLVLFFVLARREIRRQDGRAQEALRHRQATTARQEVDREVARRRKEMATAARKLARRRRGPSLFGSLASAVLWIALLGAGGFLGYMIASGGGRDPDAGLIGAVVGVLVSQLLQVLLIKRRR